MTRITLMAIAAVWAVGCNKDKAADPGGADVTLTPTALSEAPGASADPTWNRPSGKRFVLVRTDILMNSCQTPTLKSSEAALVDAYGRFAATGGAFGDKKATPGTLADTQLASCTEGKTTTTAEFVFLVPDNMDMAGSSLSYRGASASLRDVKKN